jgi:S1-C subfamily serine protease
MDTHETPTAPAPRRWRPVVAGALTGGLLAASIAVPGTWALTRHEDVASSSATTDDQAGPPTWSAPDDQQPDQQPDEQPDQLQPRTTRSGVTDATEDQSQGVVLIETTLTDGAAAGTGLVLDSSGTVLTNYHVVEGSTSIKVTIATDGTTYDADVVGFDRHSDIAVLQLDGASGLATVNLDDEDDPAVSDDVTAVGNAEGQGYLSASAGTVVALDQSITTESQGAVLGEHLTGLIQTDAYAVGGYSGGALLDDEDEVVGVTTAASSGGVAESYAIPIDDALAIADQIESGTESGDVEIGPSAYLGLGVSETGTGLGVVRVEDGGAADRAGIVAGDVLTGVGNRTVRTLDALKTALAAYEPGERATLRWTGSNGKKHRATVTLGSSPVA